MGIINFFKEYFKKLREVAKGRTHADVKISADAQGIRIGNVGTSWSSMKRLVAYRQDTYIGDVICIFIEVNEGELQKISERSPGWTQVIDAFEVYLSSSLPKQEWMLRVLATGVGSGVLIYPNSHNAN